MSGKEAKKEIARLTKTIVKNYKPEKIILFGSFAYGKPNKNSDIDMLIVKESRKRMIDRIKEVLFMVDNELPFEPRVYTSSEINSRVSLGDFFIKEIIDKGKILYEKK